MRFVAPDRSRASFRARRRFALSGGRKLVKAVEGRRRRGPWIPDKAHSLAPEIDGSSQKRTLGLGALMRAGVLEYVIARLPLCASAKTSEGANKHLAILGAVSRPDEAVLLHRFDDLCGTVVAHT